MHAHVIVGVIVAVLAAIELWFVHRNPTHVMASAKGSCARGRRKSPTLRHKPEIREPPVYLAFRRLPAVLLVHFLNFGPFFNASWIGFVPDEIREFSKALALAG